MGAAVLSGTMPGGITPMCNECGIALCWDIDLREYQTAKDFWEDWICQTCNDGVRLSLKDWQAERTMKGTEMNSVTLTLRTFLNLADGLIDSIEWHCDQEVDDSAVRDRAQVARWYEAMAEVGTTLTKLEGVDATVSATIERLRDVYRGLLEREIRFGYRERKAA